MMISELDCLSCSGEETIKILFLFCDGKELLFQHLGDLVERAFGAVLLGDAVPDLLGWPGGFGRSPRPAIFVGFSGPQEAVAIRVRFCAGELDALVPRDPHHLGTIHDGQVRQVLYGPWEDLRGVLSYHVEVVEVHRFVGAITCSSGATPAPTHIEVTLKNGSSSLWSFLASHIAHFIKKQYTHSSWLIATDSYYYLFIHPYS
jgi:hypothetical protein